MAVAGQMSNVSCINTDNLPVFNGSENGHQDPDHYNTNGQIELGILFANQFAPVQTPEPILCHNVDFSDAVAGDWLATMDLGRNGEGREELGKYAL